MSLKLSEICPSLLSFQITHCSSLDFLAMLSGCKTSCFVTEYIGVGVNVGEVIKTALSIDRFYNKELFFEKVLAIKKRNNMQKK